MSASWRTWRYYLPAGPDREWAEVVLCSTGMFAAVSEWGNYAYAWRSFEGDFREFMADDRPHWDYFVGCLGGRLTYDGEATLAEARARIVGATCALGRAGVAREMALLDESSGLENEIWLGRWLNQTKLPDAELAVTYSHPKRVRRFCERILPRLAEALRAELAAERRSV